MKRDGELSFVAGVLLYLTILLIAIVTGLKSSPEEPTPQPDPYLIKMDRLDQQIKELRLEQQELNRQMDEFMQRWSIGIFESTAYTHVKTPGVADINGEGHGITKLGLPVAEGMVAVDPSVIPLGSRVFVEGYGEALAADIGPAIKGNRVDMFLSSRSDALSWGRRQAVVIWER